MSAPIDDPAAEWERLAAIAQQMAERCAGAAHITRTSPRSTGSLREAADGLRSQLAEIDLALDLLRPGPMRHRSEKPDRWEEQATLLYDGPADGAPRYREGIIRQVGDCLRAAHEQGVRTGEQAASERALREMLAIARGLQGDAQHRVSGLERELEEYLRSIGKVTAV